MDFNDEVAAAKALIKTDGMKVGFLEDFYKNCHAAGTDSRIS